MKIDIRTLSYAEMRDLKSRLIVAMPIAKTKEVKAVKSATAKAAKVAKSNKPGKSTSVPTKRKAKPVKMVNTRTGAVYAGRGRKPKDYRDATAKPVVWSRIVRE